VNDPPAVAKVAVAPADHTLGFSSGFGDLSFCRDPLLVQLGKTLLLLDAVLGLMKKLEAVHG
jgi:hypothetical protein